MRIWLGCAAALLFSSTIARAGCEPLSQAADHDLVSCAGVKVLYLRGAPEERARTMGRLLRGPLSSRVVDYFSEKVNDAVLGQPSFVRGLFTLGYNQVVRLLHRGTPVGIAREVDAMAAGMGVDPIVLRRGFSLADTAALLNALGSYAPFRALPAAGCTSVATRGPQNKFIYGRNLDFAGAELWDQHPLVIVTEPPANSGELRHAVFGADGLLFGGITGVNEAGIAFAVQQNYSRDGGLFGVPMTFIGELVLRKARSLSEAEALLRELRPAALWTFVVADLKSGETMAVESSSRHFASRHMENGKFVQTNHLMHEETRTDEFLSVGTKTNSIYRMEKAFARLDELAATGASPEEMAALLSYQEDPLGQMVAYRDVLKALTIQTLIFTGGPEEPSGVYVSADPAPTASGKFAHFTLSQLFGPVKDLQPKSVDLTSTSPEKRARQREIARAFHVYYDQHKPLEAAAILEQHQTLDAALFRAVAQYEAGNFALASAQALEAENNPRYTGEPAYIRQSLRWVRLASLWRQGREQEARSLASTLAAEKPANKRLEELVNGMAAGQTPPAFMLELHFEFFTGDLSGRAN